MIAGEPDVARGPVLTGLIGTHIQASRSPAMHMREADALGLRVIYSLFDLAADGRSEADLTAMIEAAERVGFAGLNVTHPFKQRVIALLDELSDEARAIGAVNTLLFRDGRRIGHNTDWSGFAEGFRRQLSGVAVDRVVQVGAGGAGAATATAMRKLGCRELVLVDPERDRAERLAERLSDGTMVVRVVEGDLADAMASADGLINATPIGMNSHPGTPVDTGLLRPAMWVAEVVYFPIETELLRVARAIGCRTAHGGDMAVFQAAAAFTLFTGRTADGERMAASF